jgi:hypothetical protein
VLLNPIVKPVQAPEEVLEDLFKRLELVGK